MTPEEFKIEYPQYSHLERNALWDMMEDVFLKDSDLFIADPDREIIYHEAFTMSVLQDNGTHADFTCEVENDAETVWINSLGEKVKIKEKVKSPTGPATESYRMEILDLSKNK